MTTQKLCNCKWRDKPAEKTRTETTDENTNEWTEEEMKELMNATPSSQFLDEARGFVISTQDADIEVLDTGCETSLKEERENELNTTVETVATTGSDEVEDTVEAETVEEVGTEDNVSSKFVCGACGNKRDDCHQYKFGTFLVHKAITYYEENEPEEVTESQLRHHMRYTYNDHLNYQCWDVTKKFDIDCWLKFPQCLEDGGVAFALKLIRDCQIYHAVKRNRIGGIVRRTMINKDVRIYDYTSLLNDFN